MGGFWNIRGICGLGGRLCCEFSLLEVFVGVLLMRFSCPDEAQCLCDVYGVGDCGGEL